MIVVPHLGELEVDMFDHWLRSKPIKVKVLGGKEFSLILDDYECDENKHEFHEAISNSLSVDEKVLKKSQEHIYQYYKDVMIDADKDDDWYVEIRSPDEVWKHIGFGNEPMVTRRHYGDKKI